MQIDPTQCVSFPRSGHHLLAQCLQDYFGPALGYCMNERRRTDFADPSVNYQKNHDFDLKLKNTARYRYVVQIRHPLEAIASWYRWELESAVKAEHNTRLRRTIGRRVPGWNLYMRRSTDRRWRAFVTKKLVFWKGFVGKWVIANSHPNWEIIQYADLVGRPRETLPRAVSFLCPEHAPDGDAIDSIVRRRSIEVKNKLSDFEFFDADLFAVMEAEVAEEMRRLDIDRLFPTRQDRSDFVSPSVS